MSQLSKLLRHTTDTGLTLSSSAGGGTSFYGPLTAQPSGNPNSPNHTKTTKRNKHNKTKKTKKQPAGTLFPTSALAPSLRPEKPTWISLENTKNEAWFRMTHATPERKDTFESSNIPLPSPDCDAKHGWIYSPTRSQPATPAASPGAGAGPRLNTISSSRAGLSLALAVRGRRVNGRLILILI
ncbi:hypothetical protein BJX76DRAFT_321105 [Aspergillus varians]